MRRGTQNGTGGARPGLDGRGWLRRISTLGACLALLLHVFVVQTHGEVLSHSLGGVERVAGDVDPAGAHPHALAERGDTRTCLICQTLAGAGRAVVASKTHVPPTDDSASADARVRVRYVHVAPSHDWRSRAPPAASL